MKSRTGFASGARNAFGRPASERKNGRDVLKTRMDATRISRKGPCGSLWNSPGRLQSLLALKNIRHCIRKDLTTRLVEWHKRNSNGPNDIVMSDLDTEELCSAGAVHIDQYPPLKRAPLIFVDRFTHPITLSHRLGKPGKSCLKSVTVQTAEKGVDIPMTGQDSNDEKGAKGVVFTNGKIAFDIETGEALDDPEEDIAVLRSRQKDFKARGLIRARSKQEAAKLNPPADQPSIVELPESPYSNFSFMMKDCKVIAQLILAEANSKSATYDAIRRGAMDFCISVYPIGSHSHRHIRALAFKRWRKGPIWSYTGEERNHANLRPMGFEYPMLAYMFEDWDSSMASQTCD